MPRRSATARSDVPFLHEKQIEREADLLLAEYAEVIEPVLESPRSHRGVGWDGVATASSISRLQVVFSVCRRAWGHLV